MQIRASKGYDFGNHEHLAHWAGIPKMYPKLYFLIHAGTSLQVAAAAEKTMTSSGDDVA